MEKGQIYPMEAYKEAEMTDMPGTCFKLEDAGGLHYYRQDKDKVVHINYPNLVNILDKAHIEWCRVNYKEEFEEISKEVFREALQDTVMKFYE